MRSAALRGGVVALALMLLPVLAACTSSGSGTTPAASTTVRTRTVVSTATPTVGSMVPISTGPTTAAAAASCPFLVKQAAADQIGMRLARITVLRSGGKIVGCRFYALQNSLLHTSENLPGPQQPAIEITTMRYASSTAAHNAFVLTARRGTNPQQASMGVDNTGVCYQIAFYQPDEGTDWACAFAVGTVAVVVKTVVVSPALNVVLVARQVARKL